MPPCGHRRSRVMRAEGMEVNMAGQKQDAEQAGDGARSSGSPSRERQIVRTSYMGIVANVGLAALKGLIGIASGSVAILLDAVNNLTDVLSSVVTIVGIRLAMKPADREHPYGHGRIEYFASMLVAAIIVFAGVSSLSESLQKTFHPELPSYTAPMLAFIAVATVVKVLLGRHYRRVGTRVASDTLLASGADATFDAVISAGTLVAAVVALVGQVSIDGIVGTVISVAIIKSGWDMFSGPVNELLGMRADPELCRRVRDEVASFPAVEGVYDIVLHDYGPERHMGALNIAVADTMTAHQINDLTHSIQRVMRRDFNLELIIGILAVNTQDAHYAAAQQRVRDIAERYQGVSHVHGVYIDEKHRDLTMDALLDFDFADPSAIHDQIQSDLEQAWPGYEVHVRIERDYTQ